ncbi:MAG: DUF167 domain-containing protein [Candidatus Heimdallarchaeota archaeon]|nr:DUF167 domain-containing protein [Candidatus Heimdallarchaeota archaeon]
MTSVDIEVKVIPNSNSQSLILDSKLLIIRIKSPPSKGKANKEIISLVSKKLNVKKSRIEIIRGEKSKKKLLKIQGLNFEQFVQTLEDAKS